MLQLLFLQIFVYVSILNSFQINKTILIHIIFVFLLSIQVEITRKIKPTLSSGNELYSDRLTMKGSLILLVVYLELYVGWHVFGYLH